MASQEPFIESLGRFSTCDVSDVLLDLKHPHGGFIPNISLWSPQRQTGETKIVGPAYTVQYGTLERPLDREHYIDTVPEGAVIVISSPPTVNAVYGGLMTARAKVSHAVGTVVDGRIRDLQEHRDLAYPVFACDVGTAAPYEVVKVGGVNVPLHISRDGQEMTVSPGDYIIADLNGVGMPPGTPVQVLREFEKVTIPAGEHREVRLSLQRRDSSYWDTTVQNWRIPEGKIKISVGFSSRDLRTFSFAQLV